MSKDPNTYPEGWDAERVRRVIDYYDNQTEDEELVEILEALGEEGEFIPVPVPLVPVVEEMIRVYQEARSAAAVAS